MGSKTVCTSVLTSRWRVEEAAWALGFTTILRGEILFELARMVWSIRGRPATSIHPPLGALPSDKGRIRVRAQRAKIITASDRCRSRPQIIQVARAGRA